MNRSKVKILESKYEEENDLIIWNLQFLETGDEQKFCWPSVDLLSALGIVVKVDSVHLHEFCSHMIGKEINFVVEGLNECKLPDTRNENISDGIAEHFDIFRAHADGQ